MKTTRWYRVEMRWMLRIFAVDVTRATEKTVWCLEDNSWGGAQEPKRVERRRPRKSQTEVYVESWATARDLVLERATHNIESARQQQAQWEKSLLKIKALKVGDGLR